MATLPVFKPQIPFLGLIPGGFLPTLMIKLKGRMLTRRGRCTIDFVQSAALNVHQDVIFHISIRMDEKVIVRNTYKNKQWDHEERYGAFRIKHNESFEIVILADHEFYKLAVNNVHLGVYRHRLPLNLVQFIHVHGDVEIEHILFEQDMQSVKEQAAIGSIISTTVAGNYSVGVIPIVQPSTSCNAISSTTVVYPSHPNVPGGPMYPIITPPVPPNSQQNMYPPIGNDPPPPYHSIQQQPPYPPAPYAGQQQQNQVWVFRQN